MMKTYSFSLFLLLLATFVLVAHSTYDILSGAGHPLTSIPQSETTRAAFSGTKPFKEGNEASRDFKKRSSGSDNTSPAISNSEKSGSEKSYSTRSGSDRSRSKTRSPSPASKKLEISSSSTSVRGSDGDLTPIQLTDSAPSDHKRKYAPGSVPYHEGMYKFYDRKRKYHQAMGDAFKSQDYDSQASQHYKESESSQKKKYKHKQYYHGLIGGGLENDYIKTHNDIVKKGKVPAISDKSEAEKIINDPSIRFRQRKGPLHLVSKPLRQNKDQKRQRRQ